jgi:hypothetical protein
VQYLFSATILIIHNFLLLTLIVHRVGDDVDYIQANVLPGKTKSSITEFLEFFRAKLERRRSEVIKLFHRAERATQGRLSDSDEDDIDLAIEVPSILSQAGEHVRDEEVDDNSRADQRHMLHQDKLRQYAWTDANFERRVTRSSVTSKL